MNESKQGENMNRLLKLMLGFLIVFSFATNSYSRDQIKIVGSSTVYPYATVVAEKFGKGGKFKTPVIESTGTGGGMKLFCALRRIISFHRQYLSLIHISEPTRPY